MTGVKQTVHCKSGFTIIELLVVVVLFAVASLGISATYINLTRLHRRTANAEKLSAELRFAMESIVREARNDRVDFSSLTNDRENYVFLRAQNGDQVQIGLQAHTDTACAGLNIKAGRYCLAYQRIGASPIAWTPITGKNVNVNRFHVYYTPNEDPFDASSGSYLNDLQPRITVMIDATYVVDEEREHATSTMQTTVASRVYVR